MSMQTWTTYAYGVRENDIDKITTKTMWNVFMNLRIASDIDTFNTKLDEFCAEEGLTSRNEMTDENITDFVISYYENNTDHFIPSAEALVLGELVAKFLNVNFYNILTEMNEDDQKIVGISAYHPWEMPDRLKSASEEDYKNAFINAFAILGIDGKCCNISDQSLENWG